MKISPKIDVKMAHCGNANKDNVNIGGFSCLRAVYEEGKQKIAARCTCPPARCINTLATCISNSDASRHFILWVFLILMVCCGASCAGIERAGNCRTEIKEVNMTEIDTTAPKGDIQGRQALPGMIKSQINLKGGT